MQFHHLSAIEPYAGHSFRKAEWDMGTWLRLTAIITVQPEGACIGATICRFSPQQGLVVACTFIAIVCKCRHCLVFL